jgi:hypothetical protein
MSPADPEPSFAARETSAAHAPDFPEWRLEAFRRRQVKAHSLAFLFVIVPQRLYLADLRAKARAPRSEMITERANDEAEQTTI